MTPPTATPPPRASVLHRYGPLSVVLAAVLLVAVLASTGRDDATGGTTSAETGSAASLLPIPWGERDEAGLTEADFPEDCDPETGRVMLPSFYAPPCLAAREGVEGGATSKGVTDDSVKVVLYVAADDDLAASLQSTLDPAEAAEQTRQELVAMLADVFQTWGREIELVTVKGTGSDETSARADAVKVAEEIEAFASVGGPGQESAYAEELATRGVLCIGCGLSLPDSALQENAPYLWGTLQTPEQYLLNLGDFIIERLLGDDAIYAGDPELRERERVFGQVHFEQDPPVFGGVEETVRESGGERGYEAVVNLTYQLVISDLPETARVLVARLKEADVTTVIFLGDPIMPQYLTQAAADQDYFPEWIITGTVLTDTTVFGRMYAQDQWSHAFGVSSQSARVPQELGDAYRLYDWYYGEAPPAPKTVAVLYAPLQILMLGIHMAGPNLTPETFRDGLFAYPPSPEGGGLPTAPQLSFGEHGFFPAPDYTGVDDMMVIWWDEDATGPDEQGTEGTGMMAVADGGQRYLPGQMPSEPANVFDDAGAVRLYDEIPPDQRPPDYPSPGPGGS